MRPSRRGLSRRSFGQSRSPPVLNLPMHPVVCGALCPLVGFSASSRQSQTFSAELPSWHEEHASSSAGTLRIRVGRRARLIGADASAASVPGACDDLFGLADQL